MSANPPFAVNFSHFRPSIGTGTGTNSGTSTPVSMPLRTGTLPFRLRLYVSTLFREILALTFHMRNASRRLISFAKDHNVFLLSGINLLMASTAKFNFWHLVSSKAASLFYFAIYSLATPESGCIGSLPMGHAYLTSRRLFPSPYSDD
jgi:hypothetical protein